jgi:hypothetical protein
MFPRDVVGANAIVFFQAWQADKTLEGGRNVQFAIELEKAKFELRKMSAKSARSTQRRNEAPGGVFALSSILPVHGRTIRAGANSGARG